MSYADVRTRLKGVIKGVKGVGRVHDYMVNSTNWEEYFKNHLEKGRVNDWEISRSGLQHAPYDVGSSQATESVWSAMHTITVQGSLSLKDSGKTEVEFQDTVDALATALRENTLLDGLLVLAMEPIEATITHVMFGNVLVHRANFTFPAVERTKGSF